jgi:hypothetical protein
MRLLYLLFPAAIFVATVEPSAVSAQETGVLGGLRGSLAPDAGAPLATPGEGADDIGRVIRQRPVDTSDPTADLTTGSTVRAAKTEEDSFAPLGIRAGGFILYPSLDVTAGYTSNGAGTAGGKPSGLAMVSPEMMIRSDWDRHEATLDLRGSYEAFTDPSIDNRPTASADATSRLDLADQWTANFAAGYHFERQSVSDPNFPAGVDESPPVHDFTGSAALNGHFGRGVFTLGATAERTIYENGTAAGVVVDQGDRTNNLFGGRLRLGYELTPAITPFIEGELTRRLYDRQFDDSGLERSSRGEALRAGFVYKSEPILKGEMAIGVRQETFDDASLAALEALTVDGSLVWAPTELTTVTYTASTDISPSTSALSSGSVIYDGKVDLAYAYRRNMTADWTSEIRQERFQGTGQVDNTYRLGVGTVWKVNRNLQLTSGYVHEWLDSTAAGSDYTSDTVTVGLRFQE